MPDRAARDPHSLAFDAAGILWFTVQEGNFVGRLDPKTGKITLKPSPTPGSRPYGIAVDSRGVTFYCELGTNKIGRIDPASMKITEYVLPEGARPRRLAIGQDDTVFYTDYRRGYLGALDPKSGTVREWPSPGGGGSRPYGIAITPDGAVWYSESVYSRTRSYASAREQSSLKNGPFLQAAVWSGTWRQLREGISISRAAA
jgi:virginiamycin B lyase